MFKDDNLRAAAKRLADHYRAGTTQLENEIYKIDVEQYFDADRFKVERQHIFYKVPLLAAVGAEIPDVGSFKTLSIAGAPVLLTRGKNGEPKAFLNVCRHRGAQLVMDGQGCQSRFTCRYHGWTYSVDGALIGVSNRKNFGEIDKSERGLVTLPCEERDGLIWIVASPGGHLDLDHHLANFQAELRLFDFPQSQLICSQELPGGNWKLMMDTYLENYHLLNLHPDTFGCVAASDTAVFERFGRHQRMLAAYKTIGDVADDPSDWPERNHIATSHIIYPNTVILASPIGFTVFYVLPGDEVNTSVTRIDHFVNRPLKTAEEQTIFEQWVKLIVDAVRDEDYWIQNSVQKNLRSGANTNFLFGRNECGLHHFHQIIDEQYSQATSVIA